MRTGRQLRRAREGESVRSVLVRLAGPRRRSGAVLVEGPDARLLGIFTDSDLARLFEARREEMLDRPIGEVMTRDPVRVEVGATIAEAVEALKGASSASCRSSTGGGAGRPDRPDRPDRAGPRRARGVTRHARR